MTRKNIFVMLILAWFDVTSCDVSTEKFFDPGSSLVFASKTTAGNEIHIQVEVFVTSSDEAIWRVNDVILNAKANDSMFGTSYRRLDKTTLFTLESNTSEKFVTFVTINDDDVVTSFAINMTAEDGTTHYNLSTCWPSFSELSETSVNATFHCIPELDPRDSWYMAVGIYGMYESGTSDVVEFSMLDERRKTEFVNMTLERGTTAKANIVGSKEIIKKKGDFLFLFSSLTFQSSGVVASLSYKVVHDISRTNAQGELKFLHFSPKIELLEGEPFTIVCDAMGRNPPPVAIHKDGGKIRKSEAESHTQVTSLWSSDYVTYRHASKESAGNYSCVPENNGKKLVSSQYTEVKLSPRFRWDLSTTLENDSRLTRVSIVVEGAIGVSLECNPDGNRGGNFTLSRVNMTPMSDWNERMEAEYTWRTDKFYSLTHLSCVLKDRNDEILFDYNI